MCPMIREGDPPISYDLLEEARNNLDRDYGFALGEEDGRTVLFVRAPESKPDPFHSLEVVSFSIAEEDLAGVKDVFLVGDDRVVRVEPRTLADLVEERREEDPEVAKHLRNRLDRGHDYTVFRHKGARDHLRLGVRVPRERVDGLADEDRQALAEQLSPILSSPKGKQIRAYYLVGDEHARRVSRDELVDLVGEPLEEAVASQPSEPAPSDDEPEIETEPPSTPEKVESTGGPDPSGGRKTPPPGEAGDAGAELIEADGPPSSGAPTPSEESPSPDPPTQQAPGANVDPDGPGSTVDSDPPDGDETGAEFLGSGGSSPEPSSEPEPQEEPPPSTGQAQGGGTPSPGSDPSSSGAGSSPSESETSSSDGGADQLSPEDDGIAGLAGRGSRFDRPEPDEADDEPSGDDDVITADVEQAPDAEVPPPDEAQHQGAAPAPEPEAGDDPARDHAGSADAGQPAGGAGTAPTPEPDAQAQAAGGQEPAPGSQEAPPEAAAAARLREAGYEVVEGVEAGGQPFDFAADRSGGKRLLGLAVRSLGPEEVEALAKAGRQADADAVLAIPHDVETGAREAAWGTVVDLLPPQAAAELQL